MRVFALWLSCLAVARGTTQIDTSMQLEQDEAWPQAPVGVDESTGTVGASDETAETPTLSNHYGQGVYGQGVSPNDYYLPQDPTQFNTYNTYSNTQQPYQYYGSFRADGMNLNQPWQVNVPQTAPVMSPQRRIYQMRFQQAPLPQIGEQILSPGDQIGNWPGQGWNGQQWANQGNNFDAMRQVGNGWNNPGGARLPYITTK